MEHMPSFQTLSRVALPHAPRDRACSAQLSPVTGLSHRARVRIRARNVAFKASVPGCSADIAGHDQVAQAWMDHGSCFNHKELLRLPAPVGFSCFPSGRGHA